MKKLFAAKLKCFKRAKGRFVDRSDSFRWLSLHFFRCSRLELYSDLGRSDRRQAPFGCKPSFLESSGRRVLPDGPLHYTLRVPAADCHGINSEDAVIASRLPEYSEVDHGC